MRVDDGQVGGLDRVARDTEGIDRGEDGGSVAEGGKYVKGECLFRCEASKEVRKVVLLK